MHNLCSMHALDRVRFCIYFALHFVDEAAIMEQRGRFGSIRMVWIQNTDVSPGEEWFNDVTNLILEKWSSSASGNDESSVLPLC